MTTSATPTIPSRSTRRPLGRAVDIAISVYGAAVFTVLWVGLAVAVVSGGGILTDVWAWLMSLAPIPAVLAWIAILPIAVAAWAVDAGLAPWAMGVILVGLVAWTLVAVLGLVRTFRKR